MKDEEFVHKERKGERQDRELARTHGTLRIVAALLLLLLLSLVVAVARVTADDVALDHAEAMARLEHTDELLAVEQAKVALVEAERETAVAVAEAQTRVELEFYRACLDDHKTPAMCRLPGDERPMTIADRAALAERIYMSCVRQGTYDPHCRAEVFGVLHTLFPLDYPLERPDGR